MKGVLRMISLNMNKISYICLYMSLEEMLFFLIE